MKFCNIEVNVFNEGDFLNWDKEWKHFCTLNAQIIRLANENKSLYSTVQKTFNSIDGTWPLWVFRILYPDVQLKKVSGSDYLPKIIDKCVKLEKRIFFLGGTEIPTKKLIESININKKDLADYFCGKIESYPFSEKSQKIIIQRIKEFRPEILIVSYGAPKQEFWISDNADWLKETGIQAAYGLGGSVDMTFKPMLKAPMIVSKFGLEIIWRILLQPLDKKRWKRLFYSMGFFKYIFSSRF